MKRKYKRAAYGYCWTLNRGIERFGFLNGQVIR